ncbi:MAG: NUDIX domain-containing protein [Planctomycetota bacterium]
MGKRNPVRAAGVLIMTRSEPKQFLLMRHADRWDLPKGHCDGDESYREAARRELEEETGIAASDCQWVEPFQFDIRYEVTYRKEPGRVFEKHVRYFLASVPHACKIELTEHPDYRWWDWDPPHRIQSQTIDPLLTSVADYFGEHPTCLQSDST